MEGHESWSKDRRFGLLVSGELMENIIQECSNANGQETGGILMGYYTRRHDCAVVTDVTGPPEDSKRARATFYRGVRGLQAWIGRLWREKRHYYLGEWHYHPGGTATPSPTDDNQMRSISTDKKTRCPEPVLLLVGGNPSEHWETRAYVYPREKTREELIRQEDDTWKTDRG